MGFRLHPNEYFRGSIIEPEGERREIAVVDRGTRAGAVEHTLREAKRRNWDWHFRLLRDEEDEDCTVTVLAEWSEIAGGILPPKTRVEVPGLN